MKNANEFIREHGKTLRVVLRNSKLSTDKLERRVESMRRTLKDNHEDILLLDAIERRVRNIIDNTGKDQFSEEEIDIIMRQELGLEIREYDKSHLVNLELGEIESVTPHPVKEHKTYPFGDTYITQIGTLTYTDWMGMEDLAGLPYYKIDRRNSNGKIDTYKVFSHINLSLMSSDSDYRSAVLDTLLDENNMTKTNCGGYIGSIETVEEGMGLQDTVRANSKYSLVFDSTEATAVVKLRQIVKNMQEKIEEKIYLVNENKGETMSKVTWKPGTFVYPIPAIMVSCGTMEKANIITVAWTGIINTNPAMVYISVRPERYSYNLIKESGEFVINLTTEELAYVTDWCGVKTGSKVDKFKQMKLTKEKLKFVGCPGIKESPVSIECKVKEIKELRSHHMFMAEVLAINADEKYIDEKGAFDITKCNLISYANGKYFSMGKQVGKFGYSVQKKKKSS